MTVKNNVQIVVDGVTGVGKTTLVNILAKELELEVFEEIFRDKYDLLGRFFVNRDKWAFPMQMCFLNNRFNQYKEAAELNNAIMDRSIYSDKIFALMYKEQGYLSKEEYYVYESIYNTLIDQVNPPVLMVYLKVSTKEATRRIRRRGREDELQVENAYWEKLNIFYEENYKIFDKSPLLTIDVTDINIIKSEEDKKNIISKIEKNWKDSLERKLKKVPSL